MGGALPFSLLLALSPAALSASCRAALLRGSRSGASSPRKRSCARARAEEREDGEGGGGGEEEDEEEEEESSSASGREVGSAASGIKHRQIKKKLNRVLRILGAK